MFSGFTPRVLSAGSATRTADANIPVCKFPSTSTVTDAFYIVQAATAASSTNFLTMRMLNGKTTGNQTTNLAVNGYRAGGASVAWVAYTAKQVTTNYTFSANHWLNFRYSEDGTITDGLSNACYWAVEGNV